MFDDIAPRYDLLNHLLSFRMDILWRRRLAKIVAKSHAETVLDVATGTADLAIRMAKELPEAHLTGIDLSQAMLDIGREKTKRQHLENRIRLLQADAQKLPFPNHSFNAVTVAFGVRNYENLADGLREMCRVAKPGGLIGILEFSLPKAFPIKPLYRLYSKHLIPCIGGMVSKHPGAYRYLPASIEAFHRDYDLVALLKELGTSSINTIRLFGGIASIYVATV